MTDQVVSTGDLARLYAALAHQLERIVGSGVPAPDVVDDACQFAWTQLIRHSDRVEQETALGWLTTTAVREAFRLIRTADREPSLEALIEMFGESIMRGAARAADECFATQERFMGLGALPTRQQRLLWLHAMGLSYAEMAVHEGTTRRTVERQILRARATVKLALAE